jgi:hypothetical protein
MGFLISGVGPVREKPHYEVVFHPSRFGAVSEVSEVYREERKKRDADGFTRIKGFGLKRAQITLSH